jgi:hypothetical protein
VIQNKSVGDPAVVTKPTVGLSLNLSLDFFKESSRASGSNVKIGAVTSHILLERKQISAINFYISRPILATFDTGGRNVIQLNMRVP